MYIVFIKAKTKVPIHLNSDLAMSGKMPMCSTLSEEEKGRVRALRGVGLTQREIARRVGRSQNAVKNMLLKDAKPPKPSTAGRPSKLTETARRRLFLEARKTGHSSERLKRELHLEISARTVRRHLMKCDKFEFTKPLQSFFLTPAHRKKRLDWAESFVVKDVGFWRRVCFSDEKKFNLDGPDCIQSYWQHLDDEERVHYKKQSGGGGVMVWGCFGYEAPGPLVVVDGKQNSRMYCGTLQSHLIPFAENELPSTWIFQQDNAAIHAAENTKSWFELHDVHLLPWPSRSPDCNPIENLWGILARQVYVNNSQYNSIADLTNAIMSEWEKLPLLIFNTLIDSMPRRCAAVLRMHGGKTKY